MKPGIRQFFDYARERHAIYLRRFAGEERPWTKDAILQKYRFTNVFRELDRTTIWFRTHVRDPLRNKPDVLLATVVFRMLNRIATGEAVFCQTDLEYESAFHHWKARGYDRRVLRRAIVAHCGDGPYVTGAYILTSPPGQPKLDGMLEVIGGFAKETAGKLPVGFDHSLEIVWEWLKAFPYFGPFHAYEIVTDLRHTYLLENAEDINTWANPGPGARRGANRVFGRSVNTRIQTSQLMDEMVTLLGYSRDDELWSRRWPAWELREVEHSLCEFDKYERVRLKQGRPRGVFS